MDQRQYDAENHLTLYNCSPGTGQAACTWSDGASYMPQYQYTYGPNGKMRLDAEPGTPPAGTPSPNTTLHWDGDNLLFVSNSAGQLVQTEVEMLGEVQTPNGTQYMQKPFSGLVVNDKDYSGTTVGLHYSGHDDIWTYGSGYSRIDSNGYVRTGACVCNDYAAAYEPIYDINGQRSDGYMIQGMVVQGPRVYDQNVEQWSEPDAFKGVVHDPMSQRQYMWNNNNPVSYQDPSGFDTIYLGERPALGPYDHLFIIITDDEGSLKTVIDFGPSSHALYGLGAFGSKVQLGEPSIVDVKAFLNAGTTGTSKDSAYVVGFASCVGTCTFKNGGFDEAAAIAEARSLGSGDYRYGTFFSNSASTVTAVCDAAGARAACDSARKAFPSKTPGWGTWNVQFPDPNTIQALWKFYIP